MNIKNQISKIKYQIKKEPLLFIILFIILGFIFLQIPVNVLAGAKVKFTLFDLFAPISGAFLGFGLGAISVTLMQFSNLVIHGFNGVQTDSFLKLIATLRFLPLIVGVWYFALRQAQGEPSRNRLILIVPIVSIVIFNLHPIGRIVWFYSLFWLIPLIVWPIREKFLIAKSLGSTFTAHSIGGAVWIWAFNLPANVWVSLIPVVILERSIFALGISASYILMNNILAFLNKQHLLTEGFSLDRRYLLKSLNKQHV